MDQDQNTGAAPTGQNSPFPVSGDTGGKSPLMLVGGGIIVLILIILGWYMMQTGEQSGTLEQGQAAPTSLKSDTGSAPVNAAPDAETAALSTQGTSDDIVDIDADLKATNLESLDSSNI